MQSWLQPVLANSQKTLFTCFSLPRLRYYSTNAGAEEERGGKRVVAQLEESTIREKRKGGKIKACLHFGKSLGALEKEETK